MLRFMKAGISACVVMVGGAGGSGAFLEWRWSNQEQIFR